MEWGERIIFLRLIFVNIFTPLLSVVHQVPRGLVGSKNYRTGFFVSFASFVVKK